MQLDAKVFLTELEKLTTLRPIPHFTFLDKYIKAYYLAEEEVDHWIQTSRVRFRPLFYMAGDSLTRILINCLI